MFRKESAFDRVPMPFAQARAMIQETAVKIHVTRKRKTSFFLLSRVEQVNFINYISYLYDN